ncbi:ABC transporter ATP-binding protein [Thermasporomyces composti]|jgi:oligopeptide/dipeptide ABC transporter ATP-binding protein|uniref:Peptide/nickel transport system ATP-binding protein/oligopeptide transport system ATP-binding protein n=1 Tax=Thermasporomyces composti TaxID=696763 RepID=A0A3D9VHQ2_THECX|nr:ABC transporter ATP-binding protein [Thermasporomyces composti]REF37734.1 peptide/nickel transport system ATP-binding protein/oligopeptide transport system ATP-binding protein [Thermasporomyces composti]
MTTAPLAGEVGHATTVPHARSKAGTSVAPGLRVRDLRVSFALEDGTYPVVSGVDLTLQPGERMALVGESGSGKTVTILSLLRLLPGMARLEARELHVAGHDVLTLDDRRLDGIRGKDVAMIFQDPMSSLNPVLRVERQITAPMRRHLGLSAKDAREQAAALLGRVGIPDPARCLRAYPHELSGGMRQRVMIAIALACRPRVLLADEPTTALDVTIQAQIIRLLTELCDDLGLVCLLVTHDLGVVARFAHRVAVMYAGRVVEEGPVGDVFATPRHPYTRALLASVPTTDRRASLKQIDGAPPGLRARPSGCPFHPRCPDAVDICRVATPALADHGFQHLAACHVTAPNDGVSPPSPSAEGRAS